MQRFEKLHPKVESDDIWEEGPPFGVPIPRLAVDPLYPYEPDVAPRLLDQYLKSLDPTRNPFLAPVNEVRGMRGFQGEPYQYSPADWEL